MSFGTLVWAPYSGFYGRQPIYYSSLPLLCLGSLASALSRTVTELAISRAIQGFGAGSVMSVGAATISDIYRIEERGTAMGIYFGAVLLGPALAPLAGGLASTYASWRVMQLILFGMALAALFAIMAFLPETNHPGTRGIDKLLAQEEAEGRTGGWRFVILNPFQSLTLLKSPNILLIVLTGTFTLVTEYVLLIPLSYTVGIRYGLTTPAWIGACFLPAGLGNVSKLADKALINGRKRRGGEWYPEDRLRATLPGALILLPMSVLIFGLTAQFVDGKAGLIIILFCLLANGIGVDVVLSPSGTYTVDIMHDRSAEVMAASTAFRNTFCAITSAAVLPSIKAIGIAATNTIFALMGWLTFILIVIVIKYGKQLRDWSDMRYTVNMCES
ncbi:hypothetical protein M422DRAFT_265000 [Sphaerobolus stellatus SS14]|uniref:Major facilitator superfamily (MFS) profile domain-containing protein n=1 Tax=Sphaerobolus stellatus (strain SS14) TaxID=990650 RepID=A0A0C9UEB6_SPHS4|nr:hypothetical protein M422DRAFT_265000 [Sphaerobolus stellatus SS14]